MTNDRYTDYDLFAWVYNKHWGNLSLSALTILEEILFHRLDKNARILDLCCGAGQIVGALIERGYKPTGLDGSERLLEFAINNVPNGEFVLADARYFEIDGQYDAVVSLFDSLNHIMTIEDMNRVFCSVFAHLKPGGHFVFDLNIEQGFLERWENGSSSIIEPDHVIAIKTDYDSKEKVGRFNSSIFKKEGSFWNRTDLVLLQRCYDEEEIIYGLESAGFIDVKSIDTITEFRSGAKGRPYFYGKKAKGERNDKKGLPV